MAELRYPRFNKIYSTRQEAIEKLDDLTRAYGEPVAIRYYNRKNEVCVILAIYKGEAKGEYSISYDSNAELIPSVYTSIKDSSITEEECLKNALGGKEPVGNDIVIITDASTGIPTLKSYVYSTTQSKWLVLSSGGSSNTPGEDGESIPVGSLFLGDSLAVGTNDKGESTLEVKTDGTSLAFDEELGGLTIKTVSGGVF